MRIYKKLKCGDAAVAFESYEIIRVSFLADHEKAVYRAETFIHNILCEREKLFILIVKDLFKCVPLTVCISDTRVS